jgi:hypothetical protein
MYLQKVVQLLPYMTLHLIFAVLICLAAYVVLVRWLKALQLHWSVAVVIGVALSLYTWGGVLINMIEFHPSREKVAENEKPAGSAPISAPRSDLDFRGEFLKAVDDLTSHPEMVKPEVISQLFNQFSSLIKNPLDRQVYFTNVMQVYECQRYFLLDAQASLNAKRAVKSPERESCEKASGSFFNRETLISPEVLANNNKIIATVAKQDMTDEEKKQFSAEAIQSTLAQQNQRIELTKKIFQ